MCPLSPVLAVAPVFSGVARVAKDDILRSCWIGYFCRRRELVAQALLPVARGSLVSVVDQIISGGHE